MDSIDVDVDAEIDGHLKILAVGDIGLDTINSTVNLLTGSSVGSKAASMAASGRTCSSVVTRLTRRQPLQHWTLLGIRRLVVHLDGNLGFDTGNYTNDVVETINIETENPV